MSGGLRKTLTMPPPVMESTEKQCKVPPRKREGFLHFFQLILFNCLTVQEKNEVKQKCLPRNKGPKKA